MWSVFKEDCLILAIIIVIYLLPGLARDTSLAAKFILWYFWCLNVTCQSFPIISIDCLVLKEV